MAEDDRSDDLQRAVPVLRPVGGEERRLARALVRTAREGALAVIRSENGAPAASRVLTASDFRGFPLLLVSGLSAHTVALRTDPRCSLLVGQLGKGDPLAHPRITLHASAEFVAPDAADHGRLRERFLARHPKSALYVDFPDFAFVRLIPDSASLVAGFGRASEMTAADFIDEAAPELERTEAGARQHMNDDHADSIGEIAQKAGLPPGDWRIAAMDRFGFEVARGDTLERIEFPEDAAPIGYRRSLIAMIA